MKAVCLLSCPIKVACCTDLAARVGWSDEEDDYINLPVGAAEAKAPKAKAKVPKAKAKRKPHTKAASRKKSKVA